MKIIHPRVSFCRVQESCDAGSATDKHYNLSGLEILIYNYTKYPNCYSICYQALMHLLLIKLKEQKWWDGKVEFSMESCMQTASSSPEIVW